jgi:hypothetical protein
MSTPNCLNCDQPIPDAARYCTSCGQSANVHRLNFAHLMHEAVHFFTHADKGIFFTLRELMFRPGHVAREYIAGRRKKYFSPLNMLLILAGIYVFSISMFTAPYTREYAIAMRKKIEAVPDTAKRQKAMAIFERSQRVQDKINKYSNLLFMLATPLLAWIMWLCYRRGPYNYTEHVVANLYFVAFTSLFMTLIVAPVNYLVNNAKLFFVFMGVYLVFEIAFRTVAYSQLMQATTGRGKLKAFVTSFALVVGWLVFTSLLIFAYMRNGLWGMFE